MDMQLPRPIAGYFDADRSRSPDAMAACFSDDAVVKDAGKLHIGQDAICRWKAEASTTYAYVVEPFAIATDGGRTVVTAHVVGDFPGSPVDLRYLFVLGGERIAELEIVP